MSLVAVEPRPMRRRAGLPSLPARAAAEEVPAVAPSGRGVGPEPSGEEGGEPSGEEEGGRPVPDPPSALPVLLRPGDPASCAASVGLDPQPRAADTNATQ